MILIQSSYIDTIILWTINIVNVEVTPILPKPLGSVCFFIIVGMTGFILRGFVSLSLNYNSLYLTLWQLTY